MKTTESPVLFYGILRKATALLLVFAFSLLNITTLTAQNVHPNKAAVDYFKADRATRAARNGNNALWRISLNSPNDRAAIENTGTVIEDYGSFVVVAASKNLQSNLEKVQLETEINLPGARFEPLRDGGLRAFNSSRGGNEPDYFIVQFAAAVTDAWLDSVRQTGVEVIQYLPHQAFFVYGAPDSIAKVSTHSRVRWVGRYLPDDKLSPIVRAQIANAKDGAALSSDISPLHTTANGNALFEISVFSRADFDAVTGEIARASSGKILGTSKLPNNYFNVVTVEMPLDAVSEIAKLRDVIAINSALIPQTEDERSALIVAGNYTSPTQIGLPGYNPQTQFGVTGNNVTVAVIDDGVLIPGFGGFYLTANNVTNALNGATAGSGGHGHMVSTMVAGSTPFGGLDPQGYNYAMGVAPSANILNVPLLRGGFAGGFVGGRAASVNLTVSTQGVNNVRGTIGNNSWGDGTNGNTYDASAAEYDGFARDASTAATIDPILTVFSCGNSGTSGLTRPKMSKNTIATANTFNYRPELSASANNIDNLSSSSSRGPAADGRIKPDISAPGSTITGGAGASGYTNVNAFHGFGSGTSFAAPQIAGAAALFTEFWKNGHSGANPSPALIKAALINSTVDINGVSTTAAIPNGNEGWGRLNMKGMLNTGFPVNYLNQTTEFLNVGDSTTVSGTVGDATKPVRISLVWTDPPGVVDPPLVNNLDLTVTIGGNVYKGNVFTGGTSTTGGNADNRNNVENVFLPAGIAAGTQVSVQISATALNGDGILGNSDLTDQHFALVLSNISTGIVAQRGERADFDGDGKSDVSVFRPSNGTWYFTRSSNNQFGGVAWGAAGDLIAPEDFDGDAKTDFAVFRNGTWYLQRSTAGFSAVNFGQAGDVPVPADFDGDGKADVAVFRPATGGWYWIRSSDGVIGATQFGASGDKPIQGDFDGDAKADVAVFRPTEGGWYYLRSSDNQFRAVSFGVSTDKPVAADFDGDNKTDVAVFRPSNGNWYHLRSSDNGFRSVQFGANGDIPAPGDFDGDGKADVAVFRTGSWFIQQSTNNAVISTQFGTNGDAPVPTPVAAN